MVVYGYSKLLGIESLVRGFKYAYTTIHTLGEKPTPIGFKGHFLTKSVYGVKIRTFF